MRYYVGYGKVTALSNNAVVSSSLNLLQVVYGRTDNLTCSKKHTYLLNFKAHCARELRVSGYNQAVTSVGVIRASGGYTTPGSRRSQDNSFALPYVFPPTITHFFVS